MNKPYDMIVIGAGISGLAMAFEAEQAGKRVLVLEKEARSGGCMHSEIVPDASMPFWLEMGTHTCFNSYGRLLKILRQLELVEQMQGREKLRYRMLADGQLVSIPSRLHWFELLTHVWRLFSLKKADQSIADYYAALVGEKNYRDVFRHAFSAVICQAADHTPADMLFRKRPRDKSVQRSYTFAEGLGRIITELEQRLTIHTGQDIQSIRRADEGYIIVTASATYACQQLVCATPVLAASRLLQQAHPEIAEQLAWVNEVEIESVGVVLANDALSMDPVAGIIAADGDFYSAVSRDVVAHPHWRGITFHFKPGLLSDEEKLQRICSVLNVQADALQYVFHKTNRLPAPDMGHHRLIETLDASLKGEDLGLVGNYFNGVAVEDCLERVESELARLLSKG